MKDIFQISSKVRELKDKYIEEVKITFIQEIAKFFAENPLAEAIKWEQYTPYFNDGDACIFRINEPSIKINLYGDNESDFLDSWSIGNYSDDFTKTLPGRERNENHPLKKAVENIQSFLELEIVEQTLLYLFGDHSQITIWKEGFRIEVEGYEHD